MTIRRNIPALRAMCSLLPLFAAGLLASAPAMARPGVPASALPPANALPVPSTNPGRPFVYTGSAGVSTDAATSTMTVTAGTRTTGLNWDRFWVGSGATVNFDFNSAANTDPNFRVLNRIWSADPSVILGKINSLGQIYLINQNGILFGNGAQVNVGGLVASALGISDDLLTKGLPVNRGDSLRFSWEGDAAGFGNGFVAVDSGATITSGGHVVLLAPALVENNGNILRQGTGGETILAAGGSVLLTVPDDPNLRGLLVQTSSWQGKDALGNDVTLGGTATNGATGVIGHDAGDAAADGGVVTLAALAVNQQGSVKAGKAVNLNGDVMLVASAPETPLLTIGQTGDVAQIDWSGGFAPVDADHRVVFDQPSSGAVAYNFVNDPSRSVTGTGGRTTIDGSLSANGQVFLINDKGILFGSRANVSAATFVASGLGLTPGVMSTGLLGQINVGTPAFALFASDPTTTVVENLTALGESALTAFRQATVDVASGAGITTTGSGGVVILAGSQVNQAGAISTPGGQTILAAGAKVYLKAPYSPLLRGYSAEVDPLYVVDNSAGQNSRKVVLSRGADVNKVTQTGAIAASFGNITLVGHDVTQAGRLTTSTSITSNGSIDLLARDLVSATHRDVTNGQITTGESLSQTAETFEFGTQGGTLVLDKGSVTEILLDGSDGRTATAQQTFTPSSIVAQAAKIDIAGAGDGLAGATVAAKNGNLQFVALGTFDTTDAFTVDAPVIAQTATPSPDVGVFVGAGARLDASGATAQKSVADLFINVELRGDELANNPVQRYSALRGQTATVDIRDGVSIANISGYINQVGQTLDERAATGGTIDVRSGGSLIVKTDATLDVSGGSVNYAAATVNETRVIVGRGQTYRLNDVPAAAPVVGLTTKSHDEVAYLEGKSAGTVKLQANSLAVAGTLLGNTVRGARQRNIGDPATDRTAIPLGARLVVQDAGQHAQPADSSAAAMNAAYGQAQVRFITGRSTTTDGLEFGSTAGPTLELPQSLVDAGFSRFDIRSDGRIDIPAGVNLALAPGGSFSANGRQVEVGGDISAPNGAISLTTRDTGSGAPAQYSTLVVDSGANLSTAGQWVNDFVDGSAAITAPKATQGGSINLNSGYDLDIRAGSSLDVSGGAWQKSDGNLAAGNAGSITLATGGVTGNAFEFSLAADPRDAILSLSGALSAYSLGKGGSLEIDTTKLAFYNAAAMPVVESASTRLGRQRADRLAADAAGVAGAVGTVISADLLNQGGFSSFKFVGRDGLTVTDNTRLAPRPLSWTLADPSRYRNQPTGAALGGFAGLSALPTEMRTAATSLTLATTGVYYGSLIVGNGAMLEVDPLGAIDLESMAQLTVLGTLEAPGGSIRLGRPATSNDGLVYSADWQSRSIYLGPDSRLLAAGASRPDATTAAALAAGQSADDLRSRGLYRGRVLPGGSVYVDAGLGYLVTRPGSLIDVSGAADSFNVAGAVGRRLAYVSSPMGSAGGQVSLAARDGMFLDGDYLAAGRNGTTGGTFALRFGDAGYNVDPWNVTAMPDGSLKAALMGPRELTVFQSAGSHADQWPTDGSAPTVANYLAEGGVIDTLAHNGKARLDLAPLLTAGFGSWYLQSQDRIAFDGPIQAGVANQLRLDSPAFQGNSNQAVAFTAAALQIGNLAPPTAQPTALSVVPTSGDATFSANARDISLAGNFSWSGFALTDFTSSGDIHFDSMLSTRDRNNQPATIKVNSEAVANPDYSGRLFDGVMKAAGTVSFAATQLYPSTYSDFTVDLSADPTGAVRITRSGNASAGPLSAAGRIEFKARSIDDWGTVAAPLGEILFTAPGGRVTLYDGSVTTVAATSALPLGQTSLSGREWDYTSNWWAGGGVGTSSDVISLPAKAIRMDAADTDVKSGAKLDLSGGGEAFAWEFTPGPGGKTDVLAASASQAQTVFAIAPGLSQGFAPVDNQAMLYYSVSNPHVVGGKTVYDPIPSLKAGDQIDLGANPSGLSGSYTLLPARYAMLPGAYLVTIKPTVDSVVANAQTQADGSWLVSGSLLAANANGSYSAYSSRPLTVELAAQSVVRSRAAYQITTETDFLFGTSARLPGDAGTVSAAGRSTLHFDPVIAALSSASIAASNGRQRAGLGLAMDLAAPKIAVIDGGSAAFDASWTTLTRESLNGFGAASLLLGGVRDAGVDTTAIDVIAGSVTIATTGDTGLVGPELMLAATGDVTVGSGSTLTASGTAPAANYTIAGDGAFVRVAGGDQATVARTGVTRNQGDLNIADGAKISGHALILDATHRNLIAGKLAFANAGEATHAGGFLSLGANRINVVGDGSSHSDGLTFANADLAAFGGADRLRLTSYSTIDLYGAAALGTSDLKELILGADGIAGHGDAATTATIQAQSVRFENLNPDAAKAAFVADGAGTLAVQAQTVTFGDNDNASGNANAMRDAGQAGFAMRGFSNVTLGDANDSAAKEVRFEGIGTTAVDADLTVNAGRVVAASGSDQLLKIAGAGTVKGGGNTDTLTELGGALEIDANSLVISGRIEAPAGKLTLTAAHDLTVSGTVKAEGAAKAFADTVAYAPAGTIVLSSAAGNVAVADGATVSVSGAAGGGDAGKLSLLAQNGAVSAAVGTLSGTSADPLAAQGTLTVDAKTVVADKLADAVQHGATSHFTGQWNIRSRAGDISLASGKTVKARNVVFAADRGNIDIGGTIDASGTAKGGSIELDANRASADGGASNSGGTVTLRSGSALLAGATDPTSSGIGTAGRGGSVTIGVSASDSAEEANTAINVAGADGNTPAARIDVARAVARAAPGKVVFRVPTGIAASNLTLKGNITGTNDVALNAVQRVAVAGDYTLNAAKQADLLNQAQAAADAATALVAGNANVTLPTLAYLPGVDVRATGSITVASDWDLDGARYGGQPGVLMLHAGQDIKVNGTISDGFTSDTAPATSVKASLDSNQVNGSTVVVPKSWSYLLVAGADADAANPLQTLAPVAASDATTKGSISIAANKMIRTGTGDITLAARRNIKLLDTSALYTAGVNVYTVDGVDTSALAALPFAPVGASAVLTAVYPTGGGDVSLVAGDSIMMTTSTGGVPTIRQIDEWLFRATASDKYNTQWWARTGSFRQGVAALGGGDVTLVAGKDIQNLSVATPTNGRVPGVLGETPQFDQTLVQGGGDVTATAGGSVIGGQYYAETGHLRLKAGADVSGNPVLALGDADARVASGGDLTLGSIFNPLSSPFLYVYDNSTDSSITPKYVTYTPPDIEFKQRLGSYGENTSLDVVAVNGNVNLKGGSVGSNSDLAYALAPGRIKVAALNGDITNAGTLLMTPRADGQLDLLAAGSIMATGSIYQLDAPSSQLPSVTNPMPTSPLTLISDTVPADLHATVAWHLADNEPSRLIALTGDIVGTPGKPLGSFAEAVNVQAAGNIVNPWLVVQNNRATDVTRVSAGGDIKFETTANNKNGTIQINGPGSLLLTAGGNVDLGNSVGIVTSGNLHNPFLAEGGANVTVLAGTRTPDYAGFLDLMVGGGGGSADFGFAAQLAAFVDQYASYRSGARAADPAAQLAQDKAALLAMPSELREAFLRDEFYVAMRSAGRSALAGGGIASYQLGRDAADAMFPGANLATGNIDFFASQIKTEQGGNIDLLAPDGGVTVGIANPSADQQKAASAQGLFTIRGGDINAYVKNSFLVNQSRVFTLDGGNILVWADKGSIDAGSGAKTVSATPPPVLVVRNGQIVLDTSSSVAGSGIGVLASRADTPASDLDLFAPQGAIDAGDAGLRSTGNVFLGATRVLNSANIQAAGAVAGAAAAVAAPAPVAAPSNTAAAQNNQGAAADTLASDRNTSQGILTVEVLDLGDGDLDSGAGDGDEERKKRKKTN